MLQTKSSKLWIPLSSWNPLPFLSWNLMAFDDDEVPLIGFECGTQLRVDPSLEDNKHRSPLIFNGSVMSFFLNIYFYISSTRLVAPEG